MEEEEIKENGEEEAFTIPFIDYEYSNQIIPISNVEKLDSILQDNIQDDFYFLKQGTLICANTFTQITVTMLIGGVSLWIMGYISVGLETLPDPITAILRALQPYTLNDPQISLENVQANDYLKSVIPGIKANELVTYPMIQPVNNPPKTFLIVQN